MKWLLSIFILSILSLITKLESSCEESKALRDLDASGAHVAIVGSGFVGAAGRLFKRPRGSCLTEVEFATELRHVFRKLRITLVGRRGCSGLGAAERYVENSLETWNLKRLKST